MRRIGIIAKREFRQIARTKSYWLTLLLTPFMIAIMPLIGSFMDVPDSSSYFLVDASGRYGPAIERRIQLNQQHSVLYQFAGYARRWDLKSPRPEAVWDDGARPFNDAELQSFLAAGGVRGALAEAGPLPEGTPAFDVPEPELAAAPIPAGVPTEAGPDAFGAAISPYVVGGADRPKGAAPVGAAIYIPKDFGTPGQSVRIWTSGVGNFGLVDTVRRELNQAVRMEAAEAAGLDAATAVKVQTATAPVVISAPQKGQGRDRLILRSALPLGIAYFLLVSVFTSGAWLLQGVLEERSNKLLEAMLACVSPTELMYGKLLGIVGIGFSVIIVWGGSILAMGQFAPGPVMDVLQPAMASLNSPWLLVALVFYFVTGYLICATIYLAVGALSESMTDAQAYLMPISLGLFLPFFALGQLITNPDAIVPKVMSWIPVYTPFAMMARMGSGVEPYEVVGTSILLVAFIALELWLLGRLFRASLLRTGQPPKLAELGRLMFKPPAP